MANIGISRASYYAENAVSKLQVSKSNSMERISSAQTTKCTKKPTQQYENKVHLGLAETKAVEKYDKNSGLATTMNVLDSASQSLRNYKILPFWVQMELTAQLTMQQLIQRQRL